MTMPVATRALACAALLVSACGGTGPAATPSASAGSEVAVVPSASGAVSALTWTNRGYTDEPENPHALVLRFTEIDGTHPEVLTMARAIHAALPAVHACMRAADAAQTIDANLHVHLLARASTLSVTASPSSDGLEACLREATRSVSFEGPDRAIASIALMRPQFAEVLSVVDASANVIRGFGGCHAYEVSDCGPTDDCLNDGYRPGLCVASAPASLRFRSTTFERVGADGEVVYVAPYPFPLAMPALELADGENELPPSDMAAAANATSVVLVTDAGTVALRRVDGRVMFAERAEHDERYGWDDAQGSVTVGGVRCPITDARRSRVAVACGARFVVVRGGATVSVLDAQGALVEKKTLAPSYPGALRLRPRLDGQVADVAIRLDGQIYVR